MKQDDAAPPEDLLDAALALNPYESHWRALSPGERLARSWELRKRLLDPRAVHDAKLFPKP